MVTNISRCTWRAGPRAVLRDPPTNMGAYWSRFVLIWEERLTAHLDLDLDDVLVHIASDSCCFAIPLHRSDMSSAAAARFKATSGRVHLFNLSPATGSQSTVPTSLDLALHLLLRCV